MIDWPSSTYFTTAPHWRWWIVFYFFLGGLAGGCYFLAAMIDLFGRRADRPLARLGYYLALPLVAICGVLLIVDLSRPDRFWHMLIERNSFLPMFKPWSPMSVGAWALLLFSGFVMLSFIGALAEDEKTRRRWRLNALPLPWSAARRLQPTSWLGRAVVTLGGFFGFYIAGYTGVLLAVTNRPIWADTTLLGMLFVFSAASSSAALLILLGHRFKWRMKAIRDLDRLDGWVLAMELAALIAVMVSLGPVLQAWLNAWGLLLLFGVIIPGLVIPLVASWRPQVLRLRASTTAVFVLIGAFLLRVVIVLSSEAV